MGEIVKRLIIVAALLSFTSCAAKMPASYTQQTKTIYVLTDVVNGIGTLQLAAENAVPANILTLNDARNFVQFCVDANTTIGQSPNGWYATVNTAYQKAKNHLTPDEVTKFSGALSAFEVVLYSFAPVVK
jgi:hypothetical protein